MSEPLPFERDVVLDKPGIVGARWWNEALKAAARSVSRRKVLVAVLATSAAVGAVGLGIAGLAGAFDEDVDMVRKPSLEMQRQYGWSFGATGDDLVFDGAETAAFDRSRLPRMVADLRPANAKYEPFYVPTLFESLTAKQRARPRDDSSEVEPLAEVLRPISTSSIPTDAYRRGRGLAALFRGFGPGAAAIVDLQGVEAVAFAAGAAETFEPVFLFDNWPHPRGVVAAHRTLAAAAYYQPRFAATRSSRTGDAPPMFVLDRDRLALYKDDGARFDNRHVARMPSAEALARLGIRHALYVVPILMDNAEELDDLNQLFQQYVAHNVGVRMVSATEFNPGGADPEAYPYRGGGNDEVFWELYPWKRASKAMHSLPPTPSSLWLPKRRGVPFEGPTAKPPPAFATVAVLVGRKSGAIVAAKSMRSGSWNRAGGGWGG